MGIILAIVGIVLSLLGVGGLLAIAISLLDFCVGLWRGHKYEQEIDSLKQENASCTRWTLLFGSLALLFLVLALATSRKTA